MTENDRPTPPRTRCTFQNVNQPFCGGTWHSHSPAARKALPFTFKQHNNNQWSIINAEIILCCYPAECKAAGVAQSVLWIALSPLHGDAADICSFFQMYLSKIHEEGAQIRWFNSLRDLILGADHKLLTQNRPPEAFHPSTTF